MAPPRVLLLDAGQSSARFAGVARQLADNGFDVTVMGDRDIAEPSFPLICGRGRATETAALRRAYAVAEQLSETAYDAVIAPLRGGLAQGLLMRRATEPARSAPAVALWCDAPSRWLALAGDIAPANTAPLVADALERMTLRLADLLIGPHAAAFERVRTLGEPLPPSRQAWLPELKTGSTPPQAAGTIAELVFVGPLSRANGALVFMDAIERLAALGLLDSVQVTFLGSASSAPHGVGLDLLGVRASLWPFRFRVETETDPAKILAALARPGRIAVFAADDAEDDGLLRAALRTGCRVLASAGYDVTRDGGSARNVCGAGANAWTEGLRQALAGGAVTTAPTPPPTDWPKLVRELLAIERRQPPIARPPVRSVSVGVLHHGRPELHRALQSIPGGGGTADVVVIDNGSPAPPTVMGSRVLRIEPGVLQAAAYNRFAKEATSEALIFLDDDNTFAPDGIRRLLDAFASGWFDIVVSTLDVVDGDPAIDVSSGRFIFLGDAGMAGLFFNGFGDTAMAVRRDVFLRAGGFGDRGHVFSGLDWEFLARARAAGLAIGVLHMPAVRYARRIGTELREWRKTDAEGMRRAAAAAYGTALDAPLLARLAQGLQLNQD